jgi:hypothetical protein
MMDGTSPRFAHLPLTVERLLTGRAEGNRKPLAPAWE